jgi:hypothetical protein
LGKGWLTGWAAIMPVMKKRTAAIALTASLAGGGVAGALLGVPGSAGAQDAPSTTTTTIDAPDQVHSSNEDPAHEAGESAEREAAENAGQTGGGWHRDGDADGDGGEHHGFRGGSNEDPAHEAGESAEREAAEDAGQTGGGTTPSTTTAPAPATAPAT